jgi:hypothetical protein
MWWLDLDATVRDLPPKARAAWRVDRASSARTKADATLRGDSTSGFKALIKYVRDVPASEAQLSRKTHAAYLASMYKMAIQLYEQGQSNKALLNVLGMMLDIMEREARLLGLDAKNREPRGTPA